MRRHLLPRTFLKWLLVAAVYVLWLTVAAPLASATETTVSYVVKQGDTLETIAAAHGLTVKGLLALNPNLAGADVVYVGESLQVPSRTGPLPTVEVVCPLRYAVRDGDTLAAIAGAHGVGPGTLAQVNRRDPGGALVAGTQLCIPVVSEEVSSIGTATPVAKIECADEVQYILAGSHSATFAFSNKALAPGIQVCVQGVSGAATGFSMLKVVAETGETGWIASRHVGTWSAYRASIDPSIPIPTATPRPTRTPTPISTEGKCRDAWGASAVAYRVRTGPGTQHAHTGQYVAAGQAVCELRRDRGWVLVRLANGTTGWVHGDGITNSQPAATTVFTPTPTTQSGGYYTQILETRGILVKAGSNVDPRALQVVKDTIEVLLAPGSRSGFPECLKRAGASIVIIPWDEKISVLPDFAHFKDMKHPWDGTPLDDNRGNFKSKQDPVAATNEENILGLPSNIAKGIDTTMHELAHVIQEVCFTSAEQSRWERLYEDAKSAQLFPLDEYLMVHNNGEFFAVLTTVYFNRTSELSRFGIPRNTGREALKKKLEAEGVSEIFTFIEEIYGAR